MKKLFFFAAAICAAVSMNAETIYDFSTMAFADADLTVTNGTKTYNESKSYYEIKNTAGETVVLEIATLPNVQFSYKNSDVKTAFKVAPNKYIQFDGIDNDLLLITQNDEIYLITKNGDGLFAFSDRKFSRAEFPNSVSMADKKVVGVDASGKKIVISSNSIFSGVVGSTDVLFRVQPDGTKSKAFDVLGNGEAVAPALILYSSTANSTKKFKITVDDSGTLKATEV